MTLSNSDQRRLAKLARAAWPTGVTRFVVETWAKRGTELVSSQEFGNRRADAVRAFHRAVGGCILDTDAAVMLIRQREDGTGTVYASKSTSEHWVTIERSFYRGEG